MATHSSILIWIIPWTEEPGGLQSLGSQRVRHDLVTKHSTGVQRNSRSKTTESKLAKNVHDKSSGNVRLRNSELVPVGRKQKKFLESS